MTIYFTLFLSALASATLLPGQSEILLGTLLVKGYSPWALIAVASAGNVLGSVLNWLLGRGIERFRNKRWFPVKQDELSRAERWYQRYGKWSLLLSWAPVIGDPLTVVAGILREPFLPFLALVALAKTLRYLVVAAVSVQLFT